MQPRSDKLHNLGCVSPWTEDGFKELLKKYSICPPGTGQGYLGETLGMIALRAPRAPVTRPRLRGTPALRDDIRMAQIQGNKLVGYLDLALKQRGGTGNEGGDAISFALTYDAPPP